MEKKKLLIVGLIGLFLVGGLILIGCDEEKGSCPGDSTCTITVKQGANGLYVDEDSPISDCAKGDEYDSKNDKTIRGCSVTANHYYYYYNSMEEKRTAGLHGCSCNK